MPEKPQHRHGARIEAFPCRILAAPREISSSLHRDLQIRAFVDLKGELGAALDVEFRVDGVEMILDGTEAHAQVLGDCAITFAVRDEVRHLELARR
jgi:hypothetical protein